MNHVFSEILQRRFKRFACIQRIALLALTGTSTTVGAQQSMPVVVNQQTGEQVELTRAYWNANVDIAERSIKCDHFQFNGESAFYEPLTGFGHPGSFYIFEDDVFVHAPLLDTQEGNYVTHDVRAGFRFASWNVQDGIYSGVTPFDSHEYLEFVNYDTGSGLTNQASNNNAIRVWHRSTDISPSTYSVCFDQSGESFLPTGSADIGNTNLLVLDELADFSVQFPRPLDANSEVPVVYRDGEKVTFVRGEWDYNEQLATETVRCLEAQTGGPPLFSSDAHLAYLGGDSVYAHVAVRNDLEDRLYTNSSSISNVNLVSMLNFGSDRYMELTETGFNLYVTSTRFFNCTAPAPKRVLALMPDSCDYSTADQFDDWGWNPITQQACPPLNTINVVSPNISGINDNSVNETTDTADNNQDTGSTESTDVVQTNPTPIDNAPDDSTVSSEDNTTVQNTNDIQTNTDSTGNSSDDSTGNSNDATTAENENTVVEDEMVASNTQTDSTGTDLGSSDETASPSSGGGSFWLPILMFALAIRRPMRALQKQY